MKGSKENGSEVTNFILNLKHLDFTDAIIVNQLGYLLIQRKTSSKDAKAVLNNSTQHIFGKMKQNSIMRNGKRKP